MRNWMPVLSVAMPIRPPRASISRTIWPLARPPMAGLQDICPMRARVHGDQRASGPEARRGPRGLRPGVAAADDDDVVDGFHSDCRGIVTIRRLRDKRKILKAHGHSWMTAAPDESRHRIGLPPVDPMSPIFTIIMLGESGGILPARISGIRSSAA